MDYTKINNIFCQPLLSNAISIPTLSKEEEDYIWKKCKDNLYSGFINKSIIFDKKNLGLQKKLQKLSDNYQYKLFGMYEDVFEISNKFKENDIKAVFLKGMALNLAEIQSSDQRHCRDIDILVEKSSLSKAYEFLKTLGFSYLDKNCEDESSFLQPMHHLPPLSNSKGTIIELHHRVTSPQAYEECPLTHIFFKDLQIVKGINIPSPTNLKLHAIYHGVVHNSLGDGLIFLIDLKKITNKYGMPIDLENVHNLLNIDRNSLNKINQIMIEASNENAKSDEVQNLIESFFESNIFFCKVRKDKLIKKISAIQKLNFIRFQYQVSFFSMKFLRMTIKKFFNLVKRNYL